jgi:hypothetical protein
MVGRVWVALSCCALLGGLARGSAGEVGVVGAGGGGQNWSAIPAEVSSAIAQTERMVARENVAEWSVEEVGQLLVAKGLGPYRERFAAAGVDGNAFFALSEEDLRGKLGVKAADLALFLEVRGDVGLEAEERVLQEDVVHWDAGEVQSLLAANGLGEYEEEFRGVTGEQFFELSAADVGRLGVRAEDVERVLGVREEAGTELEAKVLKEDANSWTQDQVATILATHGLGEYDGAFREAHVDGDAFFELTDSTLQRMGVANATDRAHVLRLQYGFDWHHCRSSGVDQQGSHLRLSNPLSEAKAWPETAQA